MAGLPGCARGPELEPRPLREAVWRGQGHLRVGRLCGQNAGHTDARGATCNAPVSAAHPAIPWRAIAGIRDRIVHEYFRTNTRRIWDVVTDDLDPLEKTLRAAQDTGQA